jgi:beta-lactamase superfamily II metal-dependent hydrolase
VIRPKKFQVRPASLRIGPLRRAFAASLLAATAQASAQAAPQAASPSASPSASTAEPRIELTFADVGQGDSERKELSHWLASSKVRHATVVKAAHHGAANGVSAALIRATSPAVVVVSVGAGNRYGHPTPAVIGAWQTAGARVFRTDLHGTVRVTGTRDGRYAVYRSRR